MNSPAPNKGLYTIAVLAGDGIGPEIMAATLPTIEAVSRRFGVQFSLVDALIGGAAFERYGAHFPEETRAVVDRCDAALLGAVGGPPHERHLPKWDRCEANSILALRKAFDFYANLRPIQVLPALLSVSPLKAEILEKGVDILILRELCGDVYFGERSIAGSAPTREARDSGSYTEAQIQRIARLAFAAARNRRGKVTSVDKANVLATSQLWRSVVTELHAEYPDITLEHVFVDSCAMQLVKDPGSFDVLLTANLFGDILSDLGAILPGSLGLTPSASLNEAGRGLYEPSGGSAPDIAGKGIANPAAQILSFALLLRFSLGMEEAAKAVEQAVWHTLERGIRTADLIRPGGAAGGIESVGTAAFGQAVADRLNG